VKILSNINYDNYIKYRNELRRILGFKKYLQRHYGSTGSKLIQRASDSMIGQIDTLIDKRQPSFTRKDIQDIVEALNCLTQNLVDKDPDKYMLDLSREFSRISVEWTRNIGKNGEIERKAQRIYRMSTNQEILSDTVYALKRLISKTNQTLKYTPTAWEISKHYLKSLDGELEN